MSRLKNNFTQVPNDIINGKLPNAPLRVILYLLTYQHKDTIFPSIWTISDNCKITEKSVSRALKFLEEKKWITVNRKKGKDRRSNTYIINFEQIDGNCVLSPEEYELRNIDLEVASKLKKKKELKEKVLKVKTETEQDNNRLLRSINYKS